MKKIIFIFLYLSIFISLCIAQEAESNKTDANKTLLSKELIFPEKCLGVWEGMMYIYNRSHLLDSVKVRFTAARTETEGTFTWKKEYLSPTRPMVKDYKLVADDLNVGRYILDEGDGVELVEYNVGNKMYSSFKVDDIYLTSSTELVDGKIIFEVTSGKEFNEVKGIKNYSFTSVQRVVFSKIE